MKTAKGIFEDLLALIILLIVSFFTLLKSTSLFLPSTVALDIHMNENLKNEGLAREFVNRIQNYRKDNSFEVTDKITLSILKDPKIMPSFQKNLNYICDETLAEAINFTENLDSTYAEFNLINSITAKVKIQKSKHG